MAQYDGAIRINTKIDTKGLNRGESLMKGSFDRIGSAAKKLAATIAAAFAVGKIIEFGKAAIQAAADFEAMEAQFSQVFGDMESVASKSLSQIAKQAGITEERMKSSYTKIAAFAKTTGMDTAGSIDLANRAMVAVADSAAFYDRSLEDVTESLQSFLKGNYENDAALGLSATEFTRNAAANKLYGKSFVELTEAQKQLTLLQMVEDANRLSGALGQAAREADTWTNQIGNLNQSFVNLKANLGKFILPIAVQAVKAISSVINSINALLARLYTVTSAFRSFSELITGEKSQEGNSFGLSKEEGEDIEAGYDKAAAGADNLASANEDAAKTAKEAAKAANGQISTLDKLNNVPSESSEKASESGIGAASSIVGAMQEVDYGKAAEGETIADKLADSFAKIWDVFRQAWVNNGQGVIDSAKAALGSLKQAAISVGATFYEVFTNGTGLLWVESGMELLRSMLDVVHSIASAFTEAWNSGAGTELATAIFGMWTNIYSLLASIGDSFSRIFSNGIGVEIWTNIFGIITRVYDVIGNLASSIQTAWDATGIGDGIWQGILNIVNTISVGLHELVDATAEWAGNLDFMPLLGSIQGLLEGIEPLVGLIKDGLLWLWENVMLPLGSWTIEEALPAILSAIGSALELISNVAEAAAPYLQAIWDNFLEPAADLAGGMIVTFFEDLATAFEWISGNQTLVDILGAVVAGIIAWEAVQWLLNVALTANPIGLIITAIGLLIVAVVEIVKHWDDIKAAIGTFWDKCKEIFSNIGGWFKEKFDAIKSAVSSAWDSVKEKTSSVWNGIKTAISTVINGIKTGISTALNVIKTTWNAAWTGLKTTVVTIFNGIWTAIKSVINSILGGIEGMANGVINGINSVIGALNGIHIDIPDWIPGLGGKSFGINLGYLSNVSIPRLATGTVVPPNNEFLAVLGDNKREPEVVSPISTMKQANKEAIFEVLSELGLTGGNQRKSGNETFVFQVDGRTFFEIMRKEANQYFKCTGRSAFSM